MKTHNTDLVNYAINGMDNINDTEPVNELHQKLFNTNYFLLGYSNCEQWLINNPGIFKAIDEIKEYEQDQFGEVTTDLSSSEKVVNMYAYIKGEEILQDCPTINKNWDKKLSKALIAKIKKELTALL